MTITAINDARIGKPKTRLGTSIYPLYLPNNPTSNVKIAQDEIEVTELDSASVPQLQVYNPTADSLLIPAGKVLHGGRQTRTVNVSILVPAGVTIVIPVSCVEAGRWHGGHQFSDTNRFASRRVRIEKQRGVARNVKNHSSKFSDQGAVWDSINYELNSRQIQNETSSYLDADASIDDDRGLFGEVQKLIAEGPDAKQNGVVIAYGEKIASVEMFASPQALRASWEALMRAAMLDSPRTKGKSPSQRAVREFLSEVAQAESTSAPGVGLGTEYHVENDKFVAHALSHDGVLLHANAFATTV